MTDTPSSPVPRHITIMGIFAILWNLGGVFDFVMVQTRNSDYLAQLSDTQLAFLEQFPTWAVAVWAISVFAAFLGSIFLITRKLKSETFFYVSLVGLAIMTFRNFVVEDGAAIMGNDALIMTTVIVVIAIFLALYSRRMAAQGFLK